MYYSIEVYLSGRWEEFSTTLDLDVAKERWEYYVENNITCRVSEKRDLNRGKEWLG